MTANLDFRPHEPWVFDSPVVEKTILRARFVTDEVITSPQALLKSTERWVEAERRWHPLHSVHHMRLPHWTGDEELPRRIYDEGYVGFLQLWKDDNRLEILSPTQFDSFPESQALPPGLYRFHLEVRGVADRGESRDHACLGWSTTRSVSDSALNRGTERPEPVVGDHHSITL